MTVQPSEALNAFLQRPLHGIVATNRRDGTSQLTPVWFDWDGALLRFSTPGSTAKKANLRRDNRIAICINDPGPPMQYVTIYGEAEIQEDPTVIVDQIRKIRTKYGHEHGTTPDELRRDGRVLIVVRPTKIIAPRGLR
jgi:PPOX class probable F420-dependent enzyme